MANSTARNFFWLHFAGGHAYRSWSWGKSPALALNKSIVEKTRNQYQYFFSFNNTPCKYRSLRTCNEKKNSKKVALLPIASKFGPQEVNRFSQLCASFQPSLCFWASPNNFSKTYKNVGPTVTAFAKNESLYRRIWTKYKSSKLFWRILEDKKPDKRENRGKKTVNAIWQVGHTLVTFCWNAVKSVPLSFLPSRSRLFWWILSVNLCLLVFNSIFGRETKK